MTSNWSKRKWPLFGSLEKKNLNLKNLKYYFYLCGMNLTPNG